MRRRIAAVAAGIVLAAGGVLAVASPAQAVDNFPNCHGAGVVCFAEHINGQGLMWGPVTLRPYGRCFELPSWLNDKTSSLWNKYGYDGTPPLPVTLYLHTGCNTRLYTWGPGAYVLNIGRFNSDQATSACLGTVGSAEGQCRPG